jgi:hypothetical protein
MELQFHAEAARLQGNSEFDLVFVEREKLAIIFR